MHINWMKNENKQLQLFFCDTLTHWSQDKMATIFETTLWNGFSWMKIYEGMSMHPHWFYWCRTTRLINQYLGNVHQAMSCADFSTVQQSMFKLPPKIASSLLYGGVARGKMTLSLTDWVHQRQLISYFPIHEKHIFLSIYLLILSAPIAWDFNFYILLFLSELYIPHSA